MTIVSLKLKMGDIGRLEAVFAETREFAGKLEETSATDVLNKTEKRWFFRQKFPAKMQGIDPGRSAYLRMIR